MRKVAAVCLVLSLLVAPSVANAFTHDNDTASEIQSVRLDTEQFFESGAQVDVTVKAVSGAQVGIRLENGPLATAVEHAPGIYVARCIRYSHDTPAVSPVVAYLQDSQGHTWSRSFNITETICASVHQTGVDEPMPVAAPALAANPVHPSFSLLTPPQDTVSTPAAEAQVRPNHYDEIPLASPTAAAPQTVDTRMVRTSDNPYYDNSTVELLQQSYAADGADAAVDRNIDASQAHSYNNSSIDGLRKTYGDDSAPPIQSDVAVQSDANTGLGGKPSHEAIPSGVVVRERSEFRTPDPVVAIPDAIGSSGEAGAPPTVTNSAPPGYDSFASDQATPAPPAAAQPAPQYMPYGGYPEAPAVSPPAAAPRMR